MFRHIFTTFYRSFTRARFQIFTIIFGLTLGITVSILIFIYVSEESGYDKHHVGADRIYRINTVLDMEGKVDNSAKAGLNTGEALMEFFPEIETHTQMLNISKQTIKVGEDLYASEKVVYADSNLLPFLIIHLSKEIRAMHYSDLTKLLFQNLSLLLFSASQKPLENQSM